MTPEQIKFLQRNEDAILEVMQWRRKLPCEFIMLIGGGYSCRSCEKTFDDITPACPIDRQL